MQLAQAIKIETLAFPAISCGVYGYPLNEAAQIAVGTLNQYLLNNDIVKLVWLVCFGGSTLSIYNKHLNQFKAST